MKPLAFLALVAALAAPAWAQSIEKVEEAAVGARTPLPMAINGRVEPLSSTSGPRLQRQWPGTYFETAFEGDGMLFEVGPGDVHLRVRIDDAAPLSLVRPAPGLYRIGDIAAGPHRVRIDVASEGQSAPTEMGGFYAAAGTRPLPLTPRKRQIEFIGDSHTVGYGNTSRKRECTQEEVWATTDTSQGIAPRVAARYDADYQVNAISGRGIVRNYNGGEGDPLPKAYPFTLLGKGSLYADPAWSPALIVISLGTNDFSTPLKPGEKWKTRAELHADYEATYVAFVQQLRARHPDARFLLWATDMADGEIAAQGDKVVRKLAVAGVRPIGLITIGGLDMAGCNYHPNLADDALIADALIDYIDKLPPLAKPQPAR